MGLNFLALFAGAIADRVRRQRLLAAVQFAMTALGLVMVALILTGLLEVWHIFAITMVGGLVRMFQMPAAQSLVADTLSEDRIANGAALTTMGRNLSTIVGPLVGGILFQVIGPHGAYTAIAFLYFLSGACALLVRTTRTTGPEQRESILAAVIEGLKYVKGQQVLWATLLVAVVINLTGWPLHTTLLPIFARDVLGTGSAGLGLLTSAFGIGALIGSVSLASVRNLKNPGKFLLLAVVVWHGSMFLFAASASLYLSLAILVLYGMAFSSTQVLMLTLLLRSALPEFRGRIMGLRVLAIYAYTFGSAGSGGMAGLWGAPWAANINAAMGIVLVGILTLFTPKLRRA